MNQRILLTGSNGMVGKNILEHPKSKEYEFLTPSSQELNLLDQKQVRQYLLLHKPDMIIHAAGRVGGIQANMKNPVAFLSENMQMGLNLISSAYDLGVKSLMNMSSSCMYPRDAVNPLKEEMILQGELEPTNEGYALAKIASTRLCEYITRENPTLQYKTVIPCNLYGRHDKFDPLHSHMIPSVIRKISEAKSNGYNNIEIWGDGTARREFMYAGDLADFVFFAMNRFGEMPQNLNVGLGFDYSISEYYKVIASSVGFGGGFTYDLSKPTGMKQKLVDSKKLHTFGWQHTTSLEQGVEKTLQFFMDKKND
ncbi:GDP-L-fucose synthase family protein [Marinospirillum minutulum]|uniref:GDP-L-fucose synthase family protein n=1 Tax=Marinospirillum minutulum TaxID=64974 RepID=UPI00040066C5|nr:GDP-L-fucose synthase [Marinospirillum minutulum]